MTDSDRAMDRSFSMAFLPATVLGLLLAFGQNVRAQTFEQIHVFSGGTDGANPRAGLAIDGSGNLYGTTWHGGTYSLGTAFEMTSSGAKLVLHDFGGGASAYPMGELIFNSKGNLYGTTTGNGSCKAGCYGTVFQMSPQGAVKVLHYFRNPAKGATPKGNLVMDAAGNLYGTTIYGGAYDPVVVPPTNSQGGTVYKLTPQGETVLHSFAGGTDGNWPNGGLAIDAKGNLYGTTGRTVFKITPSGSYFVLYRFKGGADGATASGTVILDTKGNLYGTTRFGGSDTSCPLGQPNGCGTVFKLTPSGKKTVLYNFAGGSSGFGPVGKLGMDSHGNLYGIAAGGTGNCLPGGYGCGVVFEVTPTGQETVLHDFLGTDGWTPNGALIFDTQGNLYGTTVFGGNYAGCRFGCGVVFKITP